jgi:integral membrane protein
MFMNHPLARLQQLRWASLTEGATLLLLVGVAVPLKRMAGFPEAVSVLGPIHGAAFLIYVAMVLRAQQTGVWSASEVLKLLGAAFVPFGAFMVAGLFRRKQVALATT